jgi:hypothetical protein
MSSTYRIKIKRFSLTAHQKMHGSVGVGIYPSQISTLLILAYHNFPD